MTIAIRRLRWWLVLAIATAAFALPATPAHAYVCAYKLDANGRYYNPCPTPQPTWTTKKIASNYQGWAYVFGRADCPMNAYCFAAGEPTIKAWRWTGTKWVAATLNRDEKVYAWPYAGSWHWAWTERTNWVAVETSRLYTRQYNPMPL